MGLPERQNFSRGRQPGLRRRRRGQKSSVQVTLPKVRPQTGSPRSSTPTSTAPISSIPPSSRCQLRKHQGRGRGKANSKVTASLTIKGHHQAGGAGRDQQARARGNNGGAKIGFDATATIKRTDYGMGMAVPMVSDEIALRITTEANALRRRAGSEGKPRRARPARRATR